MSKEYEKAKKGLLSLKLFAMINIRWSLKEIDRRVDAKEKGPPSKREDSKDRDNDRVDVSDTMLRVFTLLFCVIKSHRIRMLKHMRHA